MLELDLHKRIDICTTIVIDYTIYLTILSKDKNLGSNRLSSVSIMLSYFNTLIIALQHLKHPIEELTSKNIPTELILSSIANNLYIGTKDYEVIRSSYDKLSNKNTMISAYLFSLDSYFNDYLKL